MTEERKPSMATRIWTAPPVIAEIKALLEEAKGYEFASAATRDKWKRIADRRLAEIAKGKA